MLEIVLTEEQKKRFWSKVQIHETDRCWEWKASRSSSGHGTYLKFKAHRVSWTLMKGPVRDGLELHHVCTNPGCARPSHIEMLTHAEHCQRDRSGSLHLSKRHPGCVAKGERHYQRKKTHCANGHEYSEENTGILPSGHRYCKECSRRSSQATYYRKKARRELED